MDIAMKIARQGGHLPIMMRSAKNRVAIGMGPIRAPFALIPSTQGRGRTVLTKNVGITLQISQNLIH
jgi:hypothetical protein